MSATHLDFSYRQLLLPDSAFSSSPWSPSPSGFLFEAQHLDLQPHVEADDSLASFNLISLRNIWYSTPHASLIAQLAMSNSCSCRLASSSAVRVKQLLLSFTFSVVDSVKKVFFTGEPELDVPDTFVCGVSETETLPEAADRVLSVYVSIESPDVLRSSPPPVAALTLTPTSPPPTYWRSY